MEIDDILFKVMEETSDIAIHSVAKLHYETDIDGKRVMTPIDGVFHRGDLICLKAIWKKELDGEITKILYKEKVLGLIRELLAIQYYIDTFNQK